MAKRNGRSVVGLRWAQINDMMFYTSLMLIFVFLLGSAILWLTGNEWPQWSQRWFWPISFAAVVGYMTNYIAVQMLFLPYRRDDGHWLRVVTLGLWRQGVVPARKPEIADAAGDQFATRVLTAERIGKELVVVAEKVFDDPDLRHRIRMMLGPIIRKQTPAIVEKLTPEIMHLISKAAKDGIKKEHLVEFVEDVLGPWLATQETRDRFVDILINALRTEAPRIVAALRQVVERYSASTFWRRLVYNLGEWTGLIDWDDIRIAFKQYLSSHEARQKFYDMVGTLIETVVNHVRNSDDLQVAFGDLSERVREAFGYRIEQFLQTNLPEIGNRLADSPAFWNWLAHEAIPQIKPSVIHWLEKDGGGAYLADKFDISGRVRDAINELKTEEVHQIVNKVSGNELGAIQVLGFVLGGLAGGLMAAVLTFGEPARDHAPDRFLDRGAEQIYDRDRLGSEP
ncbi:MAG: DUF445 domain-containing protein [Gemmatales bacterium]|nr:DUF445 domain-containing protein [Gemmatales bacterium]MDW8386078.1 DUF445 family protein [Gemmatales bacterium]